ncbi:hypothetical protein ACQEVZ_08030 [Dactylosporangium sp. CA-152071]|uniref:hypothetical protein n=1 Tax=Dactylosporangium sp. CA-152071 TaxID=3239933 RepID=UPI003D8FD934
MAVLDPSTLDVGDHFDWHGFFLGDRRAVLKTYESGLLLCDADLRPEAWIALPGDAEAVEAAVGLDEDLFAAQLWVDDEPMTMVWSLPTP